MERKIQTKVKGIKTVDGDGVELVRVLGNNTAQEFDPILMLDSFDSNNPKQFTGGFPVHPHRGIETISYLSKGTMVHKDSMGNQDAVSDGEVQWMNAGSGIMHEEMIPVSDRLLGVQLWLNLPAKDKMSKPSYTKIANKDIQEITLENGKLRLLAGNYQNIQGHLGEHHPLDYYDIQLNPKGTFTIDTEIDDSITIFTLIGDIYINNEHIEEKTAVKLSEGNKVTIINGDVKSQILFIKSKPLNEPIAWVGPIVMNSKQELMTAFAEIRNGTFVKDKLEY